MDVKTQLVKVHNNDNVAVATCPIVAGTYIATVQRPVGDMAAIAARKIIAHIEGSEVSETETYLVKPHLIIRDSIKKV